MIVVVGSANMDLIARVPHIPAAGETVLGTTLTRAPGGKGANQAVAAARGGSDVLFVGRVGDDGYGAELRESLRRAGVMTTHLVVDTGQPTGTAMIVVDGEGENSIVVVPGANGAVSVSDVDRMRDGIGPGDIVVLQLEIPVETVGEAVRSAHMAGARVLFNPAPAQPLPLDTLRSVDILVANEHEIGVLSGMAGSTDPPSAARSILETGVQTVVVTLGPRGAVVVSDTEEWDIPAVEVRTVDSTGAGDAFVGNLAAALDRNEALGKAVRFAAAAAALSVTREGAQPSMPTREVTEALMRGDVRS